MVHSWKDALDLESQSFKQRDGKEWFVTAKVHGQVMSIAL